MRLRPTDLLLIFLRHSRRGAGNADTHGSIDRRPGGVCRAGADRLGATAEPGSDQRDPRVVPVGLHGELLRRAARRRRGAGLPEATHGPALCALPDRGERRHAQEPGACRCRASRPAAGCGRRASRSRARRIDRARADHAPLRGHRSPATAGAKSGFGAAAAKAARRAAGRSCAEDRRHRSGAAAGVTAIAANRAWTDSAAAAARTVDDPAGLRGGTAGLLRDRAGGRRPHRRLPRRQWRVVVGGMPAGDPVGKMTGDPAIRPVRSTKSLPTCAEGIRRLTGR
jgi:hypothetical protein